MCVWVHPTARSRSTVIASDKSADRLFVYDLRGRVLQEIPATKPGNIDLRRGFLLAGRPVDLVVVNQREGGKELLAFTVDPHRGTLTRVDDGNIHLRFNYGGCLYRDVATAQLYFFVTTKGYGVAQYELVDNGLGKVTGRLVRNWPMQQCEAAVADDDSATLFVAEEAAGVWKFGANPDAPLPGELIIKIGSHGLRGDVEGLALLKQADGRSWLIVSDQGRNRFMVFDCSQENAFLGEFAVAGAVQSDGIEVVPGCLGPDFPEGIFACHTNSDGRPVLLSPLDRIERELYD